MDESQLPSIPLFSNLSRAQRQEIEMNPKQMMKQVQQMQAALQQRMTELRVEGSAGGGMVKAVMNGHKELQSVAIEKEAVDPNDVDMLQDLVVAAVNEATRKVDEEMQNQMGALTGGMKIPGLF